MKWFQFQIYSLVQNKCDTWSKSFWIWKSHNITCDGNSSCWLDIDEPDGYECRCDEMFEKDENDACVSSLKCAKHPCSDENSICELGIHSFPVWFFNFRSGGQIILSLLGSFNAQRWLYLSVQWRNRLKTFQMTHFDHVTSFWTKKGFRGDGKNVCYDINECRERSHNCERRNGICTNKKGTFACSCDFGYEGDGYHCVDHDECEAGDHLCPGSSLSKTVPKRLTGSGEFWSWLHMKLGRHV